jgi:hypothetical protein
VLRHIIQPAAEELNYDVARSDQVSDPGMITKQILERLLSSDLVVADLTGHNPNVFYELAVRHATGKPIVQIISADNDIPFDVYDIRTVQYKLDLDGADEARRKLINYIRAIENGAQPDNPISDILRLQRARSGNELDKLIAQLIDEVQSIPRYLEVLESRIVSKLSENQGSAGTFQEEATLMLLKLLMENPEQADRVLQTMAKFQSSVQPGKQSTPARIKRPR